MTNQDIIPRAQIDEITGSRTVAIEHWMRAYDTFHQETKAAAAICVGGAVSLSIPHGNGRESEKLAPAFVAYGEAEEWEEGRRVKVDCRERFRRLITQSVDRRCWVHMMETLGFDQLLDRQAREEFRESLNREPPEFTSENCASTFGHIWENRRDIYLRGIANTFSRLDRRFRSHDGFKIGGRLIIERALSEWGIWSNYDRRDTLRDVERVLREVDGLGPCSEGMSIASAIEAARKRETLPFVVQGDYFRVRIFNNGNLHIWFERSDLLREVNKLLAEYYGEAIGDGFNETEAEDTPAYHVTPAKKHGAFMSNDAVATKLFNHCHIGAGTRVLEPSAGTGVLARYARDKGARVSCVEIQPGLAHELQVLHGFRDVRCADFLSLTPATLGTFDVVAMNPPFDRGRDCDHVRHAMQFVAPGGWLIAVMSARAEFGEDRRHQALHREVAKWDPAYGWNAWHDLPEGSFAHAGTNVNTVVLAIKRPR